jgi:hypothetical protein
MVLSSGSLSSGRENIVIYIGYCDPELLGKGLEITQQVDSKASVRIQLLACKLNAFDLSL